MGDIFISETASPQISKKLAATGHKIYKVKSTSAVHPSIADHPDIYMCRVKDTVLIDESIQTDPDLHSMDIIFEMGNISAKYPYDVPYNAVSTNKIFMHNTKYTLPELLDTAREAGLNIINVKQGYTKCSCVTVGDNAIITSDEGIYKTICAYNRMLIEEAASESENLQKISQSGDISCPAPCPETIDSLLVRPGHVVLEGMSAGFIGGTSGAVGNTIYFNGNLSSHPDFAKITDFIEKHGFRAEWTTDIPLTDIGSIIFIP
ncbi:MAG: hypothetical protein HFE90_05435 [Firmicutes bacterium]|nr:hypothetical protein [Bacillota bacterium]